MIGKVWFIGAGPGDPDLITVRGLRALQAADVILYDNLVDTRILEGLSAQRIYVGKQSGLHTLPQEQINELLTDHATKGLRVARLKGGDPAVFGRVGEEALYLIAHGVPFEIVPGVTSAIAAPTYAGIPITHRGTADHFVVVTVHRSMDESNFSIPLYDPKMTLVLMMARGTIALWQKQLAKNNYPHDLPVALIMAATSARQRVVVTTLGDVAKAADEEGVETPTLAVVGRVVALREQLAWFENASETLASSKHGEPT